MFLPLHRYHDISQLNRGVNHFKNYPNMWWIEICDKKDCPLFECFVDPMKYKNVQDTQDNMQYTSSDHDYYMKVYTSVKTACLVCKHRKDVDLYEIMMAQKAKEALIGE